MALSRDLELLEEREKVRFAVLKVMFDETVAAGKDIRTGYFDADSVAPALGLPASTIALALSYLQDEGLVSFVGSRGGPTEAIYKLTHYGLLEVEHAIKFPDRPTEHFMPAVIQHFHESVGVVQLGSNSNATVEKKEK